jgi:hypothetical protein
LESATGVVCAEAELAKARKNTAESAVLVAKENRLSLEIMSRVRK